MEYQLKKTEILAHVEFTNLLSFSLAQNKLQRNFRTIVEALMLNQAKTDALNQSHLQLKNEHQKQSDRINKLLQQMNNKLQNIRSQQRIQEKRVSTDSAKKLEQNKQNDQIPSKMEFSTVQSNQSNQIQRLKSLVDNIKNNQNRWDEQKSQLLRQIEQVKDKLGSVGFLQNELKKLDSDLRMVRDQLGNRKSEEQLNKKNSLKSTKRASILNMITNKISQKQINEILKTQIKQKDQNKENPNQEVAINQGIDKEINSLYLELSTLKLSFQQLRDMVLENKKQSFKNNNLLLELKDNLNREVKNRKSQTEDLEKAIKDFKIHTLKLDFSPQNQSPTEECEVKEGKTGKNKRDEEDINFKNHLNDKISQLQSMIQNLVSVTEFSRLKNGMADEIEGLSNKLNLLLQNFQNNQKKHDDLLVHHQVNTNCQMNELKARISGLEQSIKNQSSQNQRKNNILTAKIQQLKKSLQDLREDLEFYQSLNAQNNNQKQQKKVQSLLEDKYQNQKIKNNSPIDEKSLESLKKYFNSKMHDFRTNLLGLFRDLQKKFNNKSNGEQEIIKIWDKINQINLYINKKADQEDAKKSFLYLEKKINRINSTLLKNEDNTEDARIAKTNAWYCLSCDKNLQSYQGKIGKHMVWDSMPLKGINKSVVNQLDEKKKGLPQLKK